jgi:hypothetical protein
MIEEDALEALENLGNETIKCGKCGKVLYVKDNEAACKVCDILFVRRIKRELTYSIPIWHTYDDTIKLKYGLNFLKGSEK